MRKNYQWTGKMRILAISMFLLAGAACLHAQEDCSEHSLKGAFGFKVTGVNVAIGVQFATTGRFVADGEGNATGTGIESVGGGILPVSFTATYKVNADCSGAAVFTFQGGITAHLFFVLVDDGNEVMIMDSDSGTVESGSAKKQFPGRQRDHD